VLLAIISLVVGVTAAAAQTAAPHTTRQGVAVLPYAPHPAPRAAQGTQAPIVPKPRKHASPKGSRMCAGLPQDVVDYENGPVNGQDLGWTINFGFSVSNSMLVNDTVTGFNFWIWLIPGDTLTSVEVQIGAAAFGNELFDQTLNFTASNCFSNQFGYNVCLESATLSGPILSGNAWVTLLNASVPSGDQAYWDMNSGAGCSSPGCPSQAQENTLGTIPSESFTILGAGTTSTSTSDPNRCMPEQSGAFSVIHDFTGNGDGAYPAGVAIDGSGNLYGPTYYGGSPDEGVVYRLAQTASGWVLNTLYNFIGGDSGSSPQGVIIGPHNILYGAGYGGLQNCTNGGYCGLIFQLRPSPKTCPAVSCSWTDNTLYSFAGSSDAWDGGNLVSDQAGNLYGVSETGGAQQHGAVFELTPSLGGWTESILYNFTGASDGGSPTTVVVGNDGKLYGMAGWGGAFGGGVVFQLTPSAGGWNEVVLYSLPYNSYMGTTNPHSLLRDSEGNLFGIYEQTPCCANTYGVIFELSPSNGNWVYTELHHGNENIDGQDLFPNMTLDTDGTLYGTETIYEGCSNTIATGIIFELSGSGLWQPLEYWDDTYFDSAGSLALDAQHNLYGTTGNCGVHYQGTVWEFAQ
jgi:uncharacterized repeat protein (TIGR03803 family)